PCRHVDSFASLPLLALLPLLSLFTTLSAATRRPVLSVTDHRRISVTERVIHPRVRRVVEVLVVDDRGGTLLAVTRVALTARRDDDFSEALPMLALVALVALVALLAIVPLLPLRPFVAVPPVLSRVAVLSPTAPCSRSV